MPIKDPQKRRASDAARKRRNRHKALAAVVELAGDGADTGADNGADGADIETVRPGTPDLGTVAGIRAALARALRRMDRGDRLDPVAVARATGSLAGVAVKLLEVGELEERLAALESKIETEAQHHG